MLSINFILFLFLKLFNSYDFIGTLIFGLFALYNLERKKEYFIIYYLMMLMTNSGLIIILVNSIIIFIYMYKIVEKGRISKLLFYLI